MTDPPQKRAPAWQRGSRKRIQASYPAQLTLQGWQSEAARLFREFWRTGNQKHLCAFVRHVHAMRVHQERPK